MAKMIGASICALKMHADIINDYSDEFIEKLARLANEQNFLIIEDRFVRIIYLILLSSIIHSANSPTPDTLFICSSPAVCIALAHGRMRLPYMHCLHNP